MSRNTKQDTHLVDIKEYILDQIAEHPADVARITAEEYGISRQSVIRHVRQLIKDGLITATGRTKARRYALKTIVDHVFSLDVTPVLAEDKEWRQKILPLMDGVSPSVTDICHYGFTEMVNNVIDHSAAKNVVISISRTARAVELKVIDDGVGIFEKLQSELGLEDPRHALLELSKGKLTSDPDRHTGEGIFFSSRMFDEFSIRSGTFYFKRFNRRDDEWLIEVRDVPSLGGTGIGMKIHPHASHTAQDVFNEFSDDTFGFTRTHVPIELAAYEGEKLLSRSQARRILARFDRFKEVLLDFQGTTEIGQAFADEIFRVFRREHPEINLGWISTTPEIEQMIQRVSLPEGRNETPGSSST